MYDSPLMIHEVVSDISQKMDKDAWSVVIEEIRKIGIEIDKDELVKALQYDREQYEKGYSDGYTACQSRFYNTICDKGIGVLVNELFSNALKEE